MLSFLFSAPGLTVTEIPKAVKPINSIGLTPTVGGYLFASPQDLDPAPIYGLKLSYDHVGASLRDSIGLEATFNYLSTKSKSKNGQSDAKLIRLDAIYSIGPRNTWVPMLVFGAGGLLVTKDGIRDDSPFFNYGLGLKYYYEDYLAFRVDLRQLFVYQSIGTNNNYELSTGVTYYFGKERKKKEPPRKKPLVLPKPIPVLLDAEDKGPEPTLVEKLGVTGAAVLGITLAPPEFEPEPLHKFGPRRPIPGPPIEPAPAPEAPAPAPAPQPVPAEPAPIAVPVAPVEPTVTQRVTKELIVEFDFNSYKVRPVYKKEIAEAAEAIKSDPRTTVLIEGHTDSVGRHKPNVLLSQRRATAVKNELVKQGVDPKRIAIKGYSFDKPKATNNTAEGRQRNRRAVAVITVMKPKPSPAEEQEEKE